MQALKSEDDQESDASSYEKVRLDIAERFAVNTVSLYDWLTGIPTEYFDTSPLEELDLVSPPALREAVRPFVGALKKQYRMHASLSRVPRDLFYFGAALHDGKADGERGCRAVLIQVAGENDSNGETNAQESAEICRLLEELNASDASKNGKTGIMVITPYRDQQALLSGAFAELRERGVIGNLDVDTYTLDSCQGREAEYVFVSLVRSRATPFLDMPKRWNVALTRAKEGLFVVGNVDAYLGEAAKARRESRADSSGRRRPLMSLIARIVEDYDRQIAESPT